MASSEDNNFVLDSTCSRGRGLFKAQISVGKILDTISTAAGPPNSQPDIRQDEGFEGGTFVGRIVEKRGILNIDLNVAPQEDGEFDSPAANNGGNGQEIMPISAVAVASVNKVGFVNEHDLKLNGNCDNQIGIQVHWSKVEKNGFCDNDIIDDSEVEMEEEDRKIRGWKTLLEVAENALREHKENLRIKEEKVPNRKRKMSREAELGGELRIGTTVKKSAVHRRQSFAAELFDETKVAAGVLAAPVVVRSTSGRALAMPNKYRDSVLDVVAEAELLGNNKSRKSATVVSTKRRSR